jgi:hypothetical protein
MNQKTNLFGDFEQISNESEGLKTLGQTEIVISSEPRKTNVVSVTTKSESMEITSLCGKLTTELQRKITVSNLGREMFLMLL